MYSFDNLSSSLGSISSALALPVSRGRHRKLVDNFSHESDVTSLQDPFTSRPYKTPFYIYYCVPRKIPRGILFQTHVEYSQSSRLLVSALAVYATACRPMFPCSVRSCFRDSVGKTNTVRSCCRESGQKGVHTCGEVIPYSWREFQWDHSYGILGN